jgi:hypothetical protein
MVEGMKPKHKVVTPRGSGRIYARAYGLVAWRLGNGSFSAQNRVIGEAYDR